MSRRALRQHFPPAFRIGRLAIGDRWRLSDLLAGPPSAPPTRPAARPGFARHLMTPETADRLLAVDTNEEARLMAGEASGPARQDRGGE